MARVLATQLSLKTDDDCRIRFGDVRCLIRLPIENFLRSKMQCTVEPVMALNTARKTGSCIILPYWS